MKNTHLPDLLNRLTNMSTKVPLAFGQLTSEQLNWKPSPNQWSVGQCLDHLVTTNELYYALFDQALRGNHSRTFWEKLPLWPTLMGNMILKSVRPETRRKNKTFPVFEPAQSDVSMSIVAKLVASNDKIADYFRQSDHLNHQKVIITSPLAAQVTYNLKTVCQILVNHEERHFNQAKRVMELSEFPV